ncbi:MAG: NADP-dependent malic enzyme [Methanomassiliicoccales archaeon]|nr:NADP-dependent malic enzyme [Methanomassiliicoccales archaeon]
MKDTGKADEERLKKAYEPARLAMKYHPFYGGKIEIVPKCPVRDFQDFAIWYTPGVAEPCRDIQKNPEQVYNHTSKWNTVAVVTDGTRVLGLGDIGPEAGLPVMEGKALLFKYLGGVDAVPICLNTKDPNEIIQAVKWITPSFGGINLEDISQPKCFTILDELRKDVEIPVWHDDQQGTATIVTAGVINALKIVGKKMNQASIAMIGAGAANISIARVLVATGVDVRNIIMVDSKGILHSGRTDLEEKFPEKWAMAKQSNGEGKTGGIKEAMKGADLVIGASRPGPDVITKDMVKGMADDAVVFATANPIPEIWPWDAKEAGARIVATGRSDFPNQINNSLGFPGIFRGALDVRAKTITDEMCIAAALEIAKTAEDKGLREDCIVPTMDEWEVFPREALAVGMKAMEQGVARIRVSRSDLYDTAEGMIRRARGMTQLLMKKGCIKPPPV